MMTEKSPYQVFAEKMMHKDSRFIPELLKAMVPEAEARLLVSLPGTAEEMATKLGRPAPEIAAELKDMFRKGLVFKKTKGGTTTFRAAAHLAQFHDASILWPEAPASFHELWRKYMEEEWPALAKIIVKFMPKPMTRVVPVGKSLEGRMQVLSADNVDEIIAKSQRFAVTRCTCRLTMHKCDRPVEVCLQVGKAADYTVERGSGREISREEALKIAREAEAAGLIHVTMNKAEVGHFICNCCGCCCQSFTMLISDGLPLCDPSRYRPEVTAEKCNACGECEGRCWFKAIGVGDDNVAAVIAEKCMGCGQCAVVCPESAIAMIETREPGFIPA